MRSARSPELAALRELFQESDPIPDDVAHAGYAAAAHMGIVRSGTLELVGDSGDEPEQSRVRGTRTPRRSRVLTFMMPGRIVEMDLTGTVPGMVRATGLVINRAGQGIPSGELLIRYPDGELSGSLDHSGAFQVDDIPRGPVSVVYRCGQLAPAVADWLVC